MKKIAILAVLILAIAAGGLFMYNVSVDNRLVDLETTFNKENAKVETFHDTMWKTIKQQAKVTDKMKDAFKDIYQPMIEGRYSKGDGTLMKWIKEDNPKFDQAAYTKLMVTIESLRKEFFAVQDTIQGVVKEQHNVIKLFPSKYFVNDDVEPFVFVPISSTKSKQVMVDRVDNDTDL